MFDLLEQLIRVHPVGREFAHAGDDGWLVLFVRDAKPGVAAAEDADIGLAPP